MLLIIFPKQMISNMESEWNTVTRRKPKQKYKKNTPTNKKGSSKNSPKRINYSFNVDTEKVYFLPANIIKSIDLLFKHGYTARDFMKELVKICHPRNFHWNSCIVYVIHESSSKDKLELMEFILSSADDRTKISNSKCGPLEFTPIFKSAYKGSIRALKMLLCAGADLGIQNKLGETVMQAIEQGNIDTNSKSPEFKIFTDERYRECKLFLENWNPNREIPVKDLSFKPYIPPSMRDRKEENSIGAIEESVIVESLNDCNLKEFLNNFVNSEQVSDYFKCKSSEDLMNAIIESAEQGNIYFEKFVSHLDLLDKSIIKDAFNNPILVEYIQLDAPFTKKKLNEICESLDMNKF